jgi:DnaJ-domain-containing protein 1
MGIFSRLGSVINSYLNDFGEQTNHSFRSSGDADFDAAYEELNNFLNNKEPYSEKRRSENTRYSAGFGSAASVNTNLPPEELRTDFEKLGVPFGADEEVCKTAYKKLLMIHHPDRHAGHDGNYKKATERSAKINAAWDRIEKWRKEKK